MQFWQVSQLPCTPPAPILICHTPMFPISPHARYNSYTDFLRALFETGCAAAAVHAAAMFALPPLRPHAQAKLAYATFLIPNLWEMISRVASERARLPSAATAVSSLTRAQHEWLLERAVAKGEAALRSMMLVMLEGAYLLLLTLDERELFGEGHPGFPPELVALATFANRRSYRIIWGGTRGGGGPIMLTRHE